MKKPGNVVQNFLERYKQIITPLALIGGFVVDIFTLTQIDQVFDNAILITHLLIVGTMIILLFSENTPFGERIRIRQRHELLKTIMLFSFGGLFSGFFLFYVRSGSFLTSAPFILLMLGLMLGAEFLKEYYDHIALRVTFYFIALFSYLIFLVPLIVNKVSAGLFIVSGILSLAVIVGIIRLLKKMNPYEFRKHGKRIIVSIVSAYLIFNIFYFLNIIPPVPLSLKFNAVYHEVTKVRDFEYVATYEEAPWYQPLRKRSRVYHRTGDEPVYVFTSVFTPARLRTEIHHRWEFFNKDTGRWEVRSDIPISIRGGRSDGFRGYSFKRAVEPGSWRVVVTNKRSQVLGNVRFKIVDAPQPVPLKQENL
jgi:hypothetical protein